MQGDLFSFNLNIWYCVQVTIYCSLFSGAINYRSIVLIIYVSIVSVCLITIIIPLDFRVVGKPLLAMAANQYLLPCFYWPAYENKVYLQKQTHLIKQLIPIRHKNCLGGNDLLMVIVFLSLQTDSQSSLVIR